MNHKFSAVVLEQGQYWKECLFVCLFRVYCPTREFFTHIEKSPFPVKGFKF